MVLRCPPCAAASGSRDERQCPTGTGSMDPRGMHAFTICVCKLFLIRSSHEHTKERSVPHVYSFSENQDVSLVAFFNLSIYPSIETLGVGRAILA